MSFVNDVMAGEADRKSLILFEDYSVIEDVDPTPIQDNKVLRLNHWRNFILVLIVLIIAIKLSNQLPVSRDSVSETYTVDLMLPEIIKTNIDSQSDSEQQLVKKTIEPIKVQGLDTSSETVEKTIVKESPAERKLEKTQLKLNQTVVEKILDFTNQEAVFEKRVVSDKTQNLDSKYTYALMLLEQGEVASAIFELRQALSLDAYYLEARLLLASTLLEQNRKQDALSIYKKGLTLMPRESRLALPLAHLLAERGNVYQALNVLLKAAPAEEVDPEYHSFIAALLQQNGKHGNAISVYQRILDVQPGNGKWWLGLGISLMTESRDEEALTAFERSLHDKKVTPALKQFASQRINDLNNRGSR